MSQDFAEMFERDLILVQHVVDDDGRGKNIPVIGSFKVEAITDDVEEDGESSAENEEEEEDNKQINMDTHFDEKFDGIDVEAPETSQAKPIPEVSSKSQNLSDAIVSQMHYYFTNKNLARDSYLMKRLMAGKNHFTPLSDFLTYKKIKSLTTDYAVLENSIKSSSSKLEVVDGKVRRIEKIPEHILSRHSSLGCKVIINCLPSCYVSSIENLQTRLEQCGKILALNIYKAIEEVPKNVLNELTSKRQTVHCPFAVAEYDNYCSAFNATTTLTDTNDWRRGLRVELVMKLRKNNPEGGDKENKNSEPKHPKKSKNKKSKKTPTQLPNPSSPCHSPKTHNIPISANNNNNNRDSPLSRSYGTSPKQAFNPLVSFLDEEERGRSNSFGTLSSSPGRWVQKKLEHPKKMPVMMRKPSHLVVREPKGPDGSKGFTFRRSSKPPLTAIAAAAAVVA